MSEPDYRGFEESRPIPADSSERKEDIVVADLSNPQQTLERMIESLESQIETLKRENERLVWGLQNHERVQEVSNQLFRDAAKEIEHLWPEASRPVGVQMICLMLAEVAKERDQLKRERDEAIRVKEGMIANIGKCGACAEAIMCGSHMHPHNEDCVYSINDRLRDEVKRLRETAEVAEMALKTGQPIIVGDITTYPLDGLTVYRALNALRAALDSAGEGRLNDFMKTKLTPKERIHLITQIASGLLAGNTHPVKEATSESWRRTCHAVVHDATDILDEIVALVDENEPAHTADKENTE